eukprot:6267856-Amphidinium_carterae.1
MVQTGTQSLLRRHLICPKDPTLASIGLSESNFNHVYVALDIVASTGHIHYLYFGGLVFMMVGGAEVGAVALDKGRSGEH